MSLGHHVRLAALNHDSRLSSQNGLKEQDSPNEQIGDQNSGCSLQSTRSDIRRELDAQNH
jgi:hypothetical protein